MNLIRERRSRGCIDPVYKRIRRQRVLQDREAKFPREQALKIMMTPASGS
jgi:hypothetical protein